MCQSLARRVITTLLAPALAAGRTFSFTKIRARFTDSNARLMGRGERGRVIRHKLDRGHTAQCLTVVAIKFVIRNTPEHVAQFLLQPDETSVPTKLRIEPQETSAQACPATAD